MDRPQLDALEIGAAAREAVATVLRRRDPPQPRPADELRGLLHTHDEAEARRVAEAAEERQQLVVAIREAELRERIAAARSRLLAEALAHEQEAVRLARLAAEREAALAEVDAEVTKLNEQRAALERAMAEDARRAETALTTNPEEASRLAGVNVGRRLTLDGFGGRAAELEQRKQEIEQRFRDAAPVGTVRPGGTLELPTNMSASLTERADDARHRAHALRRQADTDPLGEGRAQDAAAVQPVRGGVLATHTTLRDAARGPVEPVPGALGYPAGSFGAVIASRPRRRR